MGEITFIKKNKATLIFILKFAVTIAIILFLFTSLDLENFLGLVKSAHLPTLYLALTFLVIHLIFALIRWWVILKTSEKQIKFNISAYSYIIGLTFSQVLPTSIGGEAAKIFALKTKGIKIKHAVVYVAFDKISALSGLLFLFACGLIFAGQTIRSGDLYTLMLAACIVGCLGVSVLFLLITIFFSRLQQKVLPFKIDLGFVKNFRICFLNSKLLAVTFCLSMISQFSWTTSIILGIEAFHTEIDLPDALVLFSFVALVTTVPISIAGWGIRELTMVSVLGILGIQDEIGLAVSLMLGTIMLIVGMFGLIYFIVSPKPVEQY